MRRKIQLYIAGALADLNDQALVLFNYALTDIQKPTAVKNSYSKQVTLPGTPANDAIFSQAYRLDRVAGSAGFDPLARTEFAIYDDQGDIIESGYLKLNKVNRTRDSHSYAVTLYGGLGSFFYALSYRSDGEKKTLADLRYFSGYNPDPDFDDELDFTMLAANVLSNWAAQETPTPYPFDVAKVLTFVPAYEGIPDGGFDASHAVATPYKVGLPSQKEEDAVIYSTQGGGTIINLAHDIDEWDAKDLRCYLQRPALKVSALLNALANSNYNGGFTLDHSAVDALVQDLWITLPLLSSLTGLSDEDDTYTLTLTAPSVSSGDTLCEWNTPSGAVIGALTPEDIDIQVNLRGFFTDLDSPEWSFNFNFPDPSQAGYTQEWRQVAFLQLIAYSENNVQVGASNIYTVFTHTDNAGANETIADIVAACGYTPTVNTAYEELNTSWGSSIPDNYVSLPLHLTANFTGAKRFVLKAKTYVLVDLFIQGYAANNYITRYGGSVLPQIIWENYDPGTQETTYYTEAASSAQGVGVSATLVAHTQSQARSGATIKKADFLSTKNTPAEYLLSLAKTFGWCFLADQKQKKITLLSRDDFYGMGEDIIDLSDRIDRSQAIEVTPAYAGSKWYDLCYAGGAGAFYDNYKDRYGVQYGIQRVNTGYDFDSSPENIMDGLVFNEALAALDYGPFWNIIFEDSTYRPSVFAESGHTFTLWAPDGSTHDSFVLLPRAVLQPRPPWL